MSSAHLLGRGWGEKILGPDLIEETEEKVRLIRERLQAAQSRQKSYADGKRRDLHFKEGDFVYLKVSPMKGIKRFGLGKKLNPRYIGPFRVTKQIGEVAYQLELPDSLAGVHNVFHISLLRKCLKLPHQSVELDLPELQKDLTYEEYPICILDFKDRTTRRRNIRFAKVQWSNHSEDEATWEKEDDLRKSYPYLFEK